MKIKKIVGVILATLLMMMLIMSIGLADTTAFKNNAGVTQSLYYTGTSLNPGNLFADAITPNQDVKIEICDVGQQYVGAFYALNVAGTWYNALVSYSTSTNALSPTVSSGGACYETLPSAFTVSPSNLVPFGNQPDPEVFKAALPGNLFAGYGASTNPGTGGITDFIVPTGNTRLLGSYNIDRQFDQTTREFSITGTPQITFQTNPGSFSKAANDATYGISGERPAVIGFCSDIYGETCTDGALLSSATFGNLDTGLNPSVVNDQNVHRNYIVLNGLGYATCIGANLGAQIDTVSPDPVYYSQDLEVNITLSNKRLGSKDEYGGNVDVLNNFDVLFEIYPQGSPSNITFNATFRVTNNLVPTAEYFASLIWPAFAHSGMYTARITVDSADEILECVETDNVATKNFELKPITIPYFNIDGVNRTNFPVANVPYNVSFHVENSDGDILNNAEVIMKEVNGLTLSAPTQIYDRITDEFGSVEKSGLIVTNEAKFYTDYYGDADFVYIPTYNKLYLPQYGYANIGDYVGPYTLSMYGTQDGGEAFKFVVAGELLDEYPLGIQDYTATQPYDFKGIMNTKIVAQVMDFMYQTYSHFLKAIRVN